MGIGTLTVTTAASAQVFDEANLDLRTNNAQLSAQLSNLDGQNGNAMSVDPGDVSASQD